MQNYPKQPARLTAGKPSRLTAGKPARLTAGKPWAEMGKKRWGNLGLYVLHPLFFNLRKSVKSVDLDAFKSENQCLDENSDVQKERFVSDIVQVIIHVLMNSPCTIPAQLP